MSLSLSNGDSLPPPRRSKLASSDRHVRADATFSAGPRPDEVPRRRFVDRGRRIVGPAVGLGLLATLVVIAVPGLKFAYRSDETHVAIETAAFLIPGLAAVLFGGRALRGRSR